MAVMRFLLILLICPIIVFGETIVYTYEGSSGGVGKCTLQIVKVDDAITSFRVTDSVYDFPYVGGPPPQMMKNSIVQLQRTVEFQADKGSGKELLTIHFVSNDPNNLYVAPSDYDLRTTQSQRTASCRYLRFQHSGSPPRQ
jgi:hypothetical protein